MACRKLLSAPNSQDWLLSPWPQRPVQNGFGNALLSMVSCLQAACRERPACLEGGAREGAGSAEAEWLQDFHQRKRLPSHQRGWQAQDRQLRLSKPQVVPLPRAENSA